MLEYFGMYLKYDDFIYYGKGWGVYYAEDCFSAIEVFETLDNAKRFAKMWSNTSDSDKIKYQRGLSCL